MVADGSVTVGPKMVKRIDVSADEYNLAMADLNLAIGEGNTPVAIAMSAVDSYKANHVVTGGPAGFQESVNNKDSCKCSSRYSV